MAQLARNRCLAAVAIFAIAGLSRLATAQAMAGLINESEAQTDKSPAFSVHKEQQAVSDAFEDFERYRDKNAWEKAFGALGKIDEGKPGRLVPDKDGFWVPTELKVRAELLSLPPAGREAYRLFNDAKAAQLLKDASGQNELASLRKIVNRYFITGIGDQAADRLGDALFESGDFPGAERCWRMILDNFPDTAISPVLLQSKRAVALARAGDWEQFEIVRAILHQRYAGQTARIAGADQVATDWVDALRTSSAPNAAQPTLQPGGQSVSGFVRQLNDDSSPVLPAGDQPAWQLPLMDTQSAAQLVNLLNPSGWGSMAGEFTQAVPASAVDEKRVYINWLGICFAADIKTGKLLWRTDTFGDMTQKMSQALMQGTPIDTKIYGLTLVGDKLLATRRSTDNDNPNGMANARLLCVACDTGKAVWRSEQGSLSGWGFVGQPLIDGEHFYIVAHPTSSQELSMLCIGLAKGDLLWQTALGTPATGVNFRGLPTVPQPTLLLRSGKIMLLTNNGALLQIDTGTHQIDWAFSFPAQIDSQQQFYGSYVAPAVAPGAMVCAGPTLYFKESNSNLLFALDAAAPAVKWKRRIDPEAGLAGVDDHTILLAGPEIESIDLVSRELQWDDKTSLRAGVIQPLTRGNLMYLFGSRGIETIRLDSGETGPIFRGYDHDNDGGVLWKTTNRLISVSCRAVTAYPIAPTRGRSN
jgi:outer membrane protein assembly factor BamB